MPAPLEWVITLAKMPLKCGSRSSMAYGLFIGHIPIAPAISEFSSGCIPLSPWQWKGGIWIIYGLSSAFTMHGTPNYDRDFHFMDHDHPYYIGLQPWLYPAYKTGSRTVRTVPGIPTGAGSCNHPQ